MIFERRGSSYFSFIASNSSFTTRRISFSSAKIASSFLISSCSSFNSSSILSRSKHCSLLSCIAKIAAACISDSPNLAINLLSASSYASRMVLITSSILSSAIFKPSRMCALSRAFLSSNSVRLRITTRRCLINSPKISFSPKIRGWIPSTSANIL